MKYSSGPFLAAMIFTVSMVGFCIAEESDELTGTMSGGLGWTVFDGQQYMEVIVNPEVSFGKIGVGLNLLLRFDNEGNLREDDWNSVNDYLRIFDYIRYGRMGDPFYARLGALRNTTLGSGFIVYRYTNQINYDERLTGLEIGFDRSMWGFEWFDSNLGRIDISGIRGYWRPLRSMLDIPVIRDLVLGGTIVNDFRPGSLDNLTEFGLDMMLPVLTTSILDIDLYSDVAKIVDYGSGSAIGVSTNIEVVAGVFSLGSKLERRWLGERFVASCFNQFYEVERSSKPALLDTVSASAGIFGELSGDLFGTFFLLGNYEQYRDRTGNAHLEASTAELGGVFFRGYYDRRSMNDLGDLFNGFDKSVLLGLETGYSFSGPLYLVLTRERSFTELEDGSFKPSDRTFFRIEFIYNF